MYNFNGFYGMAQNNIMVLTQLASKRWQNWISFPKYNESQKLP
ncbi:MAG: hypothetical protein JWQ14_3078, partial [Adhaeribacter sp.]|nr:hypothetical protein [Adhaeribacter sp.]